MGCVYRVTNKINGKKYIGKTVRRDGQEPAKLLPVYDAEV